MTVPETTTRFTDRVADYVLHRPSYPADAIDFVMRALALAPGDCVADLGAGTGISSVLLLDRGLRVHAVEPNGPMRASAEAMLGAREGFSSHAGMAEATSLPDASVDAIVAAQAFHWFDPPRAHDETRRILRASIRPANAALLWNARRETGTPFLEGYERLLIARATDYALVRHQNVAASDALERFFGRPAKKWSTTNVQHFDWEGFRGSPLAGAAQTREFRVGQAIGGGIGLGVDIATIAGAILGGLGMSGGSGGTGTLVAVPVATGAAGVAMIAIPFHWAQVQEGLAGTSAAMS